MKYTVGAYSFDVPKFKSNKEAVKHVQERYPHLTEEEIVKHLKPSINDTDQSRGATTENSQGQEGNTPIGAKVAEGKPSGKDKSR